jgi:NAD(P)-dependent dehydrogenase (short-subunit alcohol dehydrogenase family)
MMADGNPDLHGPLYDMRGLGFAPGDAVVVTGAGSGIGRATALMAARSGLAVAVWDIVGDAAAETARMVEELGAGALAHTVDVADADAVAKAWDATLSLGNCRYLVNNAGPPSYSTAPFLTDLTVALGSVELVTTRWLDRCAEQAASLVNIASIAGNFSGGGQTISPFYATAKMGITGYTRWLATRYSGRPRANAVAPGVTLTPRTIPFLEDPTRAAANSQIPMGRLGFPEELASAILFLLSPAASYINGVLLPVDGGMAVG